MLINNDTQPSKLRSFIVGSKSDLNLAKISRLKDEQLSALLNELRQ
jgi:hypothetical protein